MNSIISASSVSLPENVILSTAIENVIGKPRGWIESRTGIRERRWSYISPLENLVKASLNVICKDVALNCGGLYKIDGIVVAENVPSFEEKPMNLSFLLKEELRRESAQKSLINMGGFTIDEGYFCTGYLNAIHRAMLAINAGIAKKVLVATYSDLSKNISFKNIETAILWGDAAAATIVSQSPDTWCSFFYSETFFDNEPLFIVKQGENKTFFKMDGKKVYKNIMMRVPAAIQRFWYDLLKRAGDPAKEIDLFLMHQANPRVVESLRDKLNIESVKVPITCDAYGNTGSVSIPLTYDFAEKSGFLKSARKVLYVGFGYGFEINMLLSEKYE